MAINLNTIVAQKYLFVFSDLTLLLWATGMASILKEIPPGNSQNCSNFSFSRY